MIALPFDAAKRHTIESVVSVFETGDPNGDYSAVVVLADGAGISYGRHQATDGGGSLDAVIQEYLDMGGYFHEEFLAWVARLADNFSTRENPNDLTEDCRSLMRFLAEAGSEPIMRDAQDHVFGVRYWEPAAKQSTQMQLDHPLSWLAVYDTTIQSGTNGVAKIRPLFGAVPPERGGQEEIWTRQFLEARAAWLRRSSKSIVVKSAVRVDRLLALVAGEQWQLQLPIHIGTPYNVDIT